MALGSKGGGGGRGRPYGMMLILAFGAAVLGVMVLHKLRERRIFTLLIKDKDQDLMDLHLLLQSEKEVIKEVKRKNEELKAKVYALRTQKMELANKVVAVQSTVSSLREEERALESTLDEKQNEIKMLRSQIEQLVKQKVAEIEEIKHACDEPKKIWSVSRDDPSNLTLANETTNWEQGESDGTGTEENGYSKNVSEVVTLEKDQDGAKNTETREAVSADEKVEDSQGNKNKTLDNGGEGAGQQLVGKENGINPAMKLKRLLRKSPMIRGSKYGHGSRNRRIISKEMVNSDKDHDESKDEGQHSSETKTKISTQTMEQKPDEETQALDI